MSRGGARAGAGRKCKYGDQKAGQLTITIPREVSATYHTLSREQRATARRVFADAVLNELEYLKLSV